MCDDFDALKQAWLNFELRVHALQNRVGIATGPVYEAVLGHRQHRHVSVIGDTVNTASNLVEVSSRTRNVILIDDVTRGLIGDSFAFDRVPDELQQRVKSGAGPFYEIALP
jgi:class 3 adenylate cyclase